MLNRFAYILPIVAVGCVWSVVTDVRRRRRLAAHFRDRPRLSEEEFGQRFFPPEQAALAAEVRRELARHVNFDLTRVQPDDTFDHDLEIRRAGRTAKTAFLMAVESHFSVRLRHAPGVRAETLGDVVREVARQAGRSPAIIGR